MAEPVPVTLVTGFLGAGKTTFLNRVLAERHGERIACVVNEFGDVGIDGRLVVRSEEEVVELANGCVCCTVRGDLVETLHRLLDRRRRRFRARPFERLMIEASGLASPGPILQTLRLEPRLAEETREAGVVSLAHAARVVEELERHPEVEEQLGYATCVVLNHADRVDAEALDRAKGVVRARNPGADVHSAVRADVPLKDVLDPAHRAPAFEPREAGHRHTEGAGSVVLRTTEPLDLHRLKMWLGFLAQKRDADLWRMKGVLACEGHPAAVVVQAVYQWLELGPGDEPAPAESVLVVIGRGLDRDELERGWRACAGS